MRQAILKSLTIVVMILVLFVLFRSHTTLAEVDYDFKDVKPFRVKLQQGEKAGLLLVTTGKWVIPPQYDNIGLFVYDRADNHAPPVVWIKLGDKYGLADKQGRVVLPAMYDHIFYAAEGVYKVQADGKWGLASADGKILLAPKFVSVNVFREGLAVVYGDNKYGYADTAGNLVVPPQYDYAGDFSEGLAMVMVGDRLGYIDKTGKMVIEPRYDEGVSCSFSEGLAAVRLNRKWGYIDRTGKTVIDFRYAEAEPFYKGVAVVSNYSRTGLIDKTGKTVLEMKYNEINYYDGGPPKVVTYADQRGHKSRCAFVDTAGNFITPFFDAAWEFSHGLAKVKVDGKYGFIDQTGKMVIEPIYNDAERCFHDGYINVELDGKPGIIDAAGQWVASRKGTYFTAHHIILGHGPDGYFCDSQGNELDHYVNHIRKGYKYLGQGLKNNAADSFLAALKINDNDHAALYGLEQAEKL